MCEKRQGGNRLLSILLDMMLALCAACSLVLDMNLRSGNNYTNWWVSMPTTPAATVAACAIFYTLRCARKRLPSLGATGWLTALFLGAWWVLATSVAATQDVNQPFLTSGQMLKALVMMLGMTCIYELFFRLIAFALTRNDEQMQLRKGSLNRLYREHTTIVCAAAVLLMWLPQLITGYPGAFSADSVSQMRQWLGQEAFTSHHPPFGTMLIGVCIDIGRWLGSATIGLYAYVLLQAVLGALVIGYSQRMMLRMHAPVWLRAGALLVCGLGFVYADNVTVVIKDIPYAYGFLLLMCELVRQVWLEPERWSLGGVLRLALAVILIILMRNNGKYVVMPLSAGLFFSGLRTEKKRMMLALALALMIGLSMAAESWIMRVWEIEPGSRREALSLPFQQTARFVRDHQDEIPQEESVVIDAVLRYDRLGRFYNPLLSDPVKATFKDEATSQELMAYFGVWFRQFLRDPMCYVKATFIQNALLFDPQTYNVAMFHDLDMPDELQEQLCISKPAWASSLMDMEGQLEMMALSLPVVAQINSVGFYCIVLLAVCLIAWKKKVRIGFILIPLIASQLIIVAGPCIENQDRYGFPIVYSMPLLLSCLSYGLRQMQKK